MTRLIYRRLSFFPVLAVASFLTLSGCGVEGVGVRKGVDASPQSLLPGNTGGWVLSGEPRVFVADNLWEYINGGAEGYLVYNFQDVATADYQNDSADLQAVVDIYRMENNFCGFGIYSAERPYEAEYLKLGSQGYFTGNALHFWQGPYYVKVTSFKEGEQVKTELRKLADSVLAGIGSSSPAPAELEVFPPANQIPNTVRYMARDVLGQSDLKNGFTAEYNEDGTEFKLFFILHDTAEQALASLESYRDFMNRYGRNLEDHTADEVTWFSAEDPYYGAIVAMQAGKTMLGAMGLDDAEKVNENLGAMQEKLAALGHI